MPSTLVPVHVTIDEHGRAWLCGSRTKVIEIVMDQVAYGWSPEEIHFQHPHLSLGQIHAALSYYYDHKAELDAEMESILEDYERRKEAAGPSPFVKRMKTEGRL